MINSKRFLFALLAASLMLSFSLAKAQPAPTPDNTAGKEHGDRMIQGVFSQLGLTDDQKRQLDDNKEQQRIKMDDLRGAMKKTRQEFQMELMKPDLDMTLIDSLHMRIKNILSQMEDQRLSSILTVRAILTREQFLKFVTLTHKHKPDQPAGPGPALHDN